MKKIVSLTLMAVLCVSLLVGCGKTVSLDKTELTFTSAGETASLTVEGKGEMVWTSSDEAVATVDANGTVTAVAPGTATITVSAGELSADCTVKCDWQVQVDLAEFYNSLFPDPDNAPAVMDLAEQAEMLDGFYAGLSAIETKQCHVYMPMITAVPFEIALVEVANSADVEAVKAILQSRIDTEVANHFNYPSVTENWTNNSKIVVNGNYIMMIAYSECDAFVDAFNALF